MRFGHATAPDWHRRQVSPLGETWHGCLRVVTYPWSPLAGTGLRLVFFSDLHFWRGRPERLPLLVQAINAQEPDWILFGGDLCRHLTDLQPALDGLADLRAKRGKLAVAGNRERAHCWLPTEFWPEAFDRIGFRFLSNETADLGPVLLAGLDDPRFGQPDPNVLAAVEAQDKPLLTLWHSPDGPAGAMGRYLGNLVLAGHTHGGQLRLPLIGAIYTSSAYGRQFDQGWFEREDGAQLYVSTGCGETGTPWLRHRLFCPPEILILEAPPA